MIIVVHFAYQLPRSMFVVAVECRHFVLINCCTWELILITLPVCLGLSRPSLLWWSVLSLCFIPAPGPTFQITVTCCDLAFVPAPKRLHFLFLDSGLREADCETPCVKVPSKLLLLFFSSASSFSGSRVFHTRLGSLWA